MASIYEDWNVTYSGELASETYGYGGDINISGGDSIDANVCSIFQPFHRIFM